MSQHEHGQVPGAAPEEIQAEAQRGQRRGILMVVIGLASIGCALAVIAAISGGRAVQRGAELLAARVAGGWASDSSRFARIAIATMDSSDVDAPVQRVWRVMHVTPESSGGACVGLAVVPLPGEELRDGMVGVRVRANGAVEGITPYQTGCR